MCLAQAEIYVGILGDTRAAYIGVDSAAVTGTVYASLYEEIASGFNLDASDVLHENVAGWRTVAVIWGSLWSLLL